MESYEPAFTVSEGNGVSKFASLWTERPTNRHTNRQTNRPFLVHNLISFT